MAAVLSTEDAPADAVRPGAGLFIVMNRGSGSNAEEEAQPLRFTAAPRPPRGTLPPAGQRLPVR